MGIVLYSYILVFELELSSSWVASRNPKRRYKDLENHRHVGLGQEAARASVRTGGTRTSKSGDTRVSKTGGNSGLRNDEGTRSLKIKGF